MDAFIHGNTQTATTPGGNNANPSTQTHLPESPPDSGSEPPYSPSDLHGAAGIVTTGNSNVNVQQGTNGYETDIRLGGHHLGSHLGQQQTTTSALHVSDLTLSQQLLSDPTNNIYLNGGVTSPSPNLVDQQTGLTVVPEVTLKHEGELIIPDDASPDPGQYMLHQTGGAPVTLIELGQRPFKNGLLEAGSSDDLVQLMPGVYNGASAGNVSSNNSSSNNGIQSPHVRQSSSTSTRKRKGSNSVAGRPPSAIIKADPELNSGVTRMIGISKSCSNDTSLDTINNASLDSSSSTNGGGDGSDSCPMQSIRFAPFQQHQWHVLCNQNLQEL